MPSDEHSKPAAHEEQTPASAKKPGSQTQAPIEELPEGEVELRGQGWHASSEARNSVESVYDPAPHSVLFPPLQ